MNEIKNIQKTHSLTGQNPPIGLMPKMQAPDKDPFYILRLGDMDVTLSIKQALIVRDAFNAIFDFKPREVAKQNAKPSVDSKSVKNLSSVSSGTDAKS